MKARTQTNILRRWSQYATKAQISKTMGIGVLLVLISFAVLSYTRAGVYTRTNTRVEAVTSDTLNFQARLLNASGSIVADGNYNVEFNLYNVSSGGSTQWTETRVVAVKAGYLSVYLGSVTPFPSTIQWDQEQWLTMNVNSDGEMTPRLKLTAVPFAFQASELVRTVSGNRGVLSWLSPTSNRTINLPDASGTVALSSGGSFTNNGVLYGNGTSVIQATSAGNTGQCLVGTTGSAPSWGSCSSTLQQAYTNSTNPQITLNSTQGNITIQDNATPIGGNLLEVTNNGGATKYLAVTSAGISTSGTITSGGALTVTSGGASITGGIDNNSGGITEAGSITGVGTNITASGALTIQSNTTSTITLDSGTTGDVNVGTGSNAKIVTIGNSTGGSSVVINSGTGNIDIGTTSQARNINIGTASAAQTLTLGSSSSSSATTLQGGSGGVQISSGANVTIGSADTTGTLLVVDSKTDTGDPTGTDGAIYYNSFMGKFRCFQDGFWVDCIGGAPYTGTSASFVSGVQNMPANASGQIVETMVFTSSTGVSTVAGVTGFTAPADGSFRTCMIKNNAAITAGTLNLRWTVNGASVGSGACAMDPTNNRQATSVLNPGVVSFSAGDTIGIAFDTSAGFLPAGTNDFTVYWTVEYNASGGGGGGGGTLQDAYNDSVSANILTADNKDLTVQLADTAIDSNFIINIASGSTGQFKIQDNGSDVLSVDSDGDITTSGTITLGNTAETVAGTIRWTGLDFEGFDGSNWLSLTSGGGGTGLGSNYVNVVKQVNETVNNSTALQPDDELAFSIGPNEEWTYRFVVQANSGTIPDLRFAVSAPAGATCLVSYSDPEGASSAGQYGCGVTSASIPGNGAVDLYEVTGTVLNGPTAGTVNLEWAQFTLNASNTIVYAGSYLNAFRSIGSGGVGQPFVQGGNSFGTSAVLGTSDNNNLTIQTNAQDRITILAGGNVGIGDTTPASLFTVGTSDALQINSSGDLTTSGTISSIGNINTTGGVIQTNSTTRIDNSGNLTNIGDITGSGAMTFSTGGVGSLLIKTQNQTAGSTNSADVNINSGNASGATSNSGNINIDSGSATGTAGLVRLGGTYASGVEIGRSGTTTSVLGALDVNGLTTLTGNTTLGANLLASGSSTVTTGNTIATPDTNTTTVELTAAGSFANNDVIYINNAGQDYYTRIVSGGGTTTLTVSPAVSYDASAPVTKYNVQNIGADTNDYTTLANRFFQGYFLGGVVVGAGSTTLSDGNLSSTGDLVLQRGGGLVSIGGNLDIAGTITGDGSGITNIDGAAIVGGSIADGSLSANVALLSGTQTFSGQKTFSAGLIISASGASVSGGIDNNSGGITEVGALSGVTSLSLNGAISGGTTISGSGDINTTGGSLQTGGITRIDNSGNLSNIGTIGASGNINTTGGVIQTNSTTRIDNAGALQNITSLSLSGAISGGTTISGSGDINTTGGSLQTGGITRIDNSGNLSNIGNLSLSGAISGGTTYSGSGNINTTSGAIQTNSLTRIDNSGNLTNIGDITGTGAVSLTSGGTGSLTLKSLNQSVASTNSASVSLLSGNATGSTSNSGNVTIDSGTATGTAGIVYLGTANASAVNIGRNGTTTTIDGVASLSGNTTIGGTLGVSGSSLSVGTNSLAGTVTLYDGSSNTGAFQTAALGSNRTYTLPDSSGTVCLDSNNCSLVQLGPSVTQTDSSTNSSIDINKTGASGNILTLEKNGNGVFTVFNGGATQISADDAAALQVRNAGGTVSYLTVNTSGSIVQVGSSISDATGILFVLDSKSGADPTGVNGGSYYNTTDNVRRCYDGGVWSDCSTTRIAGETTISSAQNNITVTLNGSYEYLHCRIDVKGRSVNGGVYLRFNGDAGGASYGWNEYDIINTAVGDAQDSSDSEIQLTGTDTSNIPASADLRITNFSDTQKIVDWSYSGATGVGTNNRRYSGTGNWANTTNSISTVQFLTSTGTFNAGSHAWCEGRNIR